jgi:hypothetical protein
VINTREEEAINMPDFIPGEAYRLDIVTEDNTVIVDSLQGTIKGDVIDTTGAILVDVSTGKLYGSLIGNFKDSDDNILLDEDGNLTGSVRGTVYNDDGAVAFDGFTGQLTADVAGNVLDIDGDIMVNSSTKTISADIIEGSFYGDLTGSINSVTDINGTFNGDFVGDLTGDVVGDVTGQLFGNVTGDVTGNLMGNVFGNLEGSILGIQPGAAIATDLVLYRDSGSIQQWDFAGGLCHHTQPLPGALAAGAIVELGATRQDSALKAHVNNWNGTPVIQLTDGAPNIIGNHYGEFNYRPNTDTPSQTILSADINGTKIGSVNNIIQLGNGSNDEVVKVNANEIFFETPTSEDTICVMTYNNTFAAKQTLVEDDRVFAIDAWGHNGTNYAHAGILGIQVSETPAPGGTSIPSCFRVVLSSETESYATNANNELMFTNKGVLEVPVFKAKGTNFANRDAMTTEPGMIIFNTSNNTFQGFNGTSWVDLG